MLNFLTESKERFDNLRIFNLFMGFLHLIQAGAMFFITLDVDPSPVGTTTEFLQLTQNPDGTFNPPVGVEETVLSINIGMAAVLFLLISSVAHFLIATPGIFEWYKKNLQRNANYARWYEYAFSSSVMIVIIALLVGYNDAPGLLMMFVLNAMMNLFGLLMEKYNGTEDRVDWTAYIYGVIAGLIPWIVITWYFVGAVEGYEGETPIPDFVYGILISIFIFFNIFAINMFLQYKKIGPWKNYLFGEASYIILSLVAKSALAWQVWSGTLRDA